MKVIERYDTTTCFMELPFHLIRNEQEAQNIKNTIGDKRIVTIHRSVDEATFQPIIWFAIEEKDKPMSQWMKYVSPMTISGVQNIMRTTDEQPS